MYENNNYAKVSKEIVIDSRNALDRNRSCLYNLPQVVQTFCFTPILENFEESNAENPYFLFSNTELQQTIFVLSPLASRLNGHFILQGANHDN
jgi:hypothetical protein